MIQTEYNGESLYLLNLEPDWRESLKAEFEVAADLVVGLSNREGRRAYAGTLRVTKLSYTAVAEGAAARVLSGCMRDYQAQPVAVPFWPGKVTWAERESAAIDGGLLIVFKDDWSQWQIVVGPMADVAAPEWVTDEDLVAPLLWGRLNKREVSWIHPDLAELAVDFTEASPASYALLPVDDDFGFALGPAPSDAYQVGPRILPFEVSFENPVGRYNVAIVRQQLGFGRQPSETVYPQTVARGSEAPYVIEARGDEAGAVGRLLKFFLDFGPGDVFWAPTWQSDLRLSAGIAAGDTALQVFDTGAVRVGDWVAVYEGGGLYWTPRVLAKDGTSVTVDAAPGNGFSAQALVSHLLLCRFEKTRLSLEFVRLDLVRCALPLREVPPEYTPASDETLGTTLGLLPTRCYLYEFTRVLGGLIVTDRFTSYERDLQFDNQAYLSRKLEHGEIRQGIALDRDEVEIRTDTSLGGGLLQLATMKCESPLMVTIHQGELKSETVEAWDAAVLFTGEIVSAKVQGKKLTGKAVTGGSLWDRKLPRMVFQRTCNHALFSVGCGLAKGDWEFRATVQDPGTVGYPFAFVLQGLARAVGGAPAYTANWFAGGWIEFGNPGVSWCRRAILLSSAVAAGVVTVTLDRDPEPYPAIGDAVILYPGCDGAMATCKARFNNYPNFGGHPFLTVANPSLVKPSASNAGGKK